MLNTFNKGTHEIKEDLLPCCLLLVFAHGYHIKKAELPLRLAVASSPSDSTACFAKRPGDIKIQVAATGTVCSHLQMVAIFLFAFKPI